MEFVMSGHSKWHSIKHKKAATDAKRGKAFSRINKEITVAARIGGGDPGFNPRLRLAVEKAKAENMPKDTIDRAIKKGTGELEGYDLEEVLYEGYGAGGVAMLIEVTTDNRNRTLPEIRHLFSKYGGNLGEPGSVAWMFQKKGYLVIEKDKIEEEELLEIALEAGAEDVNEDGGSWEVFTPPDAFEEVLEAIKKKDVPLAVQQLGMFPQSHVKIEGKNAQQVLKLMDFLEEHEDVQNVWANFDIEEEELEAAMA
jgi:YebC/PmpR family DNA-binding regulatory protein